VLAALDRFAALEPALDVTIARSRQSGDEPQLPEEKETERFDEIDRLSALDALTIGQARELEALLREQTKMLAPQLPARRVLRLLRHEQIRDVVAEILGEHCHDLFFRRWAAIARMVEHTGISIGGSFEKSIETALRFDRLGSADTLAELETVIRVAVRMRDPAKLLALLEDLPVERSAAYLLDEVQRQGVLRDCTLALKNMVPWRRNAHRRRWLEERLLRAEAIE
jgi:hypothetical protein